MKSILYSLALIASVATAQNERPENMAEVMD